MLIWNLPICNKLLVPIERSFYSEHSNTGWPISCVTKFSIWNIFGLGDIGDFWLWISFSTTLPLSSKCANIQIGPLIRKLSLRKPDPSLSVSMGNQPCPSMERVPLQSVSLLTGHPVCLYIGDFWLWISLSTSLFPFPASARTSKSAHSFASYRPAKQDPSRECLYGKSTLSFYGACAIAKCHYLRATLYRI